MSEPESCPKRIRKPSNRLRRAQGMHTDSDEDDDTVEDNDSHGPAPSSVMSTPAPPTSSMSVPSTVHRTQSSTSLVSQTSVITTPGPRTEEDRRRAKFDERFQTATSTEEEVLSMSC